MSVKKDWTGYKYNTFEVLDEDEEHTKLCEERINKGELKRYNKKYLCKCECGNIVSVSVTQIAKNKPLSCGCKRIYFAEDLTGQQFGDWTVLYRDFELEYQKSLQEITPHAYWRCKCICGAKKSIMASHLRSSASKGCGCKQADRVSYAKTKDHTGESFGKLKVINIIRNKNNRIVKLVCKCECGNIYNVYNFHDLTSDNINCCSSCRPKIVSINKQKAVYERNQRNIVKNGSLGDSLLEKFPYLDMGKLWSDKNKYSPFNITKKSHLSIYLICPECGKEYETNGLCLYSRVYDVKCPECLRKETDSSLQKAVKDYLNNVLNLETLHESKCTLSPINPRTGALLRYDNELVGFKAIIEVHGEQHYKATDNKNWLKEGQTPEQMLKEQQYRDRIKKEYAIKMGYRFLEISYKEILEGKYKEILDNFVKEVKQFAS